MSDFSDPTATAVETPDNRNLPAVIPQQHDTTDEGTTIDATPERQVEGDEVTQERVPEPQYLELETAQLLPMLSCVSKDETRLYLNGVFLHRTPDGFIRAVSTDGQRMLVVNLTHDNMLPENERPDWLTTGVILPADNLATMLKLIGTMGANVIRPKAPKVSIGWAVGRPKIELSDSSGEVRFQVAPAEGTYPDYQEIIDRSGMDAFAAGEHREFEPVAFSAEYLKAAGVLAAQLGAVGVSIYAKRGDHSGAAVITFDGVDGAVLYLMAMNSERVGFNGPSTQAIIAPAVRGHVAALRAHLTRTERKAKKERDEAAKAELEKMAESFRARIERALARVGSGDVAIPAPPVQVAPVITSAPAEDPDAPADAEGYAIGGIVGDDSPADPETAEAEAEPEPAPEPELALEPETPAVPRAKLHSHKHADGGKGGKRKSRRVH